MEWELEGAIFGASTSCGRLNAKFCSWEAGIFKIPLSVNKWCIRGGRGGGRDVCVFLPVRMREDN